MNIFNFIKSNVSILDVVKEYATLKRAGIYWKGKCPFHNEKTGSFTVSPHREIFYCFGCHAGGDVIAFMSQAERCSQLEAAQLLAERFGITIPEEYTHKEAQPKYSQNEKERYERAHAATALWCHQQLKEQSFALTYLKQRGVLDTTIKNYCLGYFPAGHAALKSLLEWVKKDNLIASDLIASNIVLEGKHGLYSPFEDRLIFPIKDHLGRFCAFGGRVIKPDDQRPKYYNSHDHPLFAKGTVLFGMDVAKKTIQKEDHVFLVEGYMDCIIMAQSGYQNTVATLGTACTQEHLHLLSRYTQKLSVIYDGDTAGKRALLRLVQLCWNVDLEFLVVILPAGEDPASYLVQGKDLQPLLTTSQDIFSFYIHQAGIEFTQQPMQERINRVKGVLDIIALIQDPLKKDLLLQKAAASLGLTPELLKQELRKIKAPQHAHAEQETNNYEPEGPEGAQLEKKIFSAILMQDSSIPDQYRHFLSHFLPQPFNHLVEIYWKHVEQSQHSKKDVFNTFFEKLSPNEQRLTSQALAAFGQEATTQTTLDLINQFKKKQWKVLVNDVKVKLADAQKRADTSAVLKIIDSFQKLRQEFMPKDHV